MLWVGRWGGNQALVERGDSLEAEQADHELQDSLGYRECSSRSYKARNKTKQKGQERRWGEQLFICRR